MKRALTFLLLAAVIGPSGLLLAGFIGSLRDKNAYRACAYGLGIWIYGMFLFFGSGMVADHIKHGV